MEQKLTAQDKYELKNIITNTDDPDAITSFVKSKTEDDNNINEAVDELPKTIVLSEAQKRALYDGLNVFDIAADDPENYLINPEDEANTDFDNFKYKDNKWYLEQTYDDDYPWSLIIEDGGVWDDLTWDGFDYVMDIEAK